MKKNESLFTFLFFRSTRSYTLLCMFMANFKFTASVCCFAVRLKALASAFLICLCGILLRKLYHYGIRKNVHKLFSSFLSNRQLFTALNNAKSDKILIVVSLKDQFLIPFYLRFTSTIFVQQQIKHHT